MYIEYSYCKASLPWYITQTSIYHYPKTYCSVYSQCGQPLTSPHPPNIQGALWKVRPLLIVFSISFTSSLVSSYCQTEKCPLSLKGHLSSRSTYWQGVGVLFALQYVKNNSFFFLCIPGHQTSPLALFLCIVIFYSLRFSVSDSLFFLFTLPSSIIIGDVSIYLLAYQSSVIFILTLLPSPNTHTSHSLPFLCLKLSSSTQWT